MLSMVVIYGYGGYTRHNIPHLVTNTLQDYCRMIAHKTNKNSDDM